MKPNTFIKDRDVDDLIYLDNKIIGDYKSMINTIIRKPDVKYHFENFSQAELKTARIMLRSYNRKLKNNYKKNGITITTHRLKQQIKKHYYLDSFLTYKYTLPFEWVDKIEFKKIENRDIITIEGIVSVYGISNEYGFYNIDQDDFIPINELEENKKILIETLTGKDIIHHVKRRVR